MGVAGATVGSGGGGNGYSGNYPTPDQIAANDKRCGGRAASERPGGALGP
ncbi:transmembrane anchored protein [Mesorhizobium sp. B2-3-14]|nr:transmembrane anchored protein [Mesorhizobium sp. B2-4-18]TPL79687.1 transmembrane anchored protein [Mesorhizobium sp. B2-3-14]